MYKNRHKNFLDETTDMWINIWRRRELGSAMCKNKHEEHWSMFIRFRFCRCMECDLFSFFSGLVFFPFPPCLVAEQLISWSWPLTENTTLGQGKKSFCRTMKRTRTRFKVWRELDSKMWWENKIQKCAKLTTRNLGSLWRTVWQSQGANL